MTVTISDVRKTLKNMPEEFVSDEVIQQTIESAYFIVNHEKSAAASTADIEKTVELNAAHLTLMAYASEIERSLGVIAPSLGALIEQYRIIAEKALKYVKRATRVQEPYYDTPYSLYEYAQTLASWGGI